MAKAVIQLETLTCPSCVKKIETVMKKTPGVELVNVLFNSSKVKIEYDDTKTNVDELKTTISNIGYEVVSSS